MAALVLSQHSHSGISPLLTHGAVERTGNDQIPGHYCSDHHVWMVDDLPIVQSCSSLAELTTKTDANRERDDSSIMYLLELQTKTKAAPERDDED